LHFLCNVTCENEVFILMDHLHLRSLLVKPSVTATHDNGKESTVNRALGGSTYPGKKLVRSSHCKKFLVVMKHSNLYLGLVLPSGG
jgi:hypothetical protein